MTFYQKIETLCKNKGTTVTALAAELGFSSSAGTTWKKSKGLPRNSTIKKIADYFGVPVFYLTDNSGDVIESQNITDNHGIIGHAHAPVTIINGYERKLAEQEVALLELFEKMDVVKKAQLLAFAAELTK